MKNKKITSLKELKIRKKELRMEMELTKREFSHSMGSSRAELKNFLVQKVALPAGVAGLGIAGISKLVSNATEEKYENGHTTVIKKDSSSVVLKTILPLLVSAVQTYFFKKTAEEAEEPTTVNVYDTPTENHYVANGQYVESQI